MAVLTPFPKMRFFTPDGLPLSGGKLYTYELGTTTPLITYQDQDGTSPNTNPIILDSRGRCTVWLDAPCTFELRDQFDVLLPDGGDVDPITDFVQEETLESYYTKTEADTRYYTQAEVDALVAGDATVISLSVGDYVDTAADTPPTGTLACDGAAYSRETYDDLFALIGTRYGEGNGTTTFNVPDWRGMFPRCWDNGAGVDPNASTRTDSGDGTTGDNNGTRQADATARPNSSFTTNTDSHNHSITLYGYGEAASGTGKAVIRESGTFYTAYDAHSHTITGGGDAETRPVNMYQLRCIVY